MNALIEATNSYNRETYESIARAIALMQKNYLSNKSNQRSLEAYS
ncbi:hypothetical protein VB713_03525 [Anabaena cylindrica UHCC 0172]|nr:hypothetical protein [Anabaena cylindrica]MEA5550059.1 hypothetical protein [Anabaena cylindrica UHCC 0172]